MRILLTRAIRISIGLTLLGPALLIALAATEGGTRLLADQAQRWSAGVLRLEQVQGRLLGRLELQGIRLRKPELAFDLKRLVLDWSPVALLSGRIELKEVSAAGLSVRIPKPAEDKPLSAAPRWSPSDLTMSLDVHLQGLRVEDLQVQIGEPPPLRIDGLELVGTLEGSDLVLHQLRLTAPDGHLLATGQANLTPPVPLTVAAEWSRRLRNQGWIGGRVSISGDSHSLTVEHHGSGAVPLELRARVTDLLASPGWDLDLVWPEMVLIAGTDSLTLGSGQLHSEGNLSGYRVETSGSLRGSGLPPSLWVAQALGNGTGISLAPLEVTNPLGEVSIGGTVKWSEEPAFDLRYEASGHDMRSFHPELPQRLDVAGRLAGRLQGEALTLETLSLALKDNPARVELKGRILLNADGQPGGDGELHWDGLQWPLFAVQPVVASESGSLHLRGNATSYRLELTTGVSGQGLPGGEWRLNGDGDQSRLQIRTLTADLFEGTMEGTAHVQWQPELAGRIELRLDDVTPVPWIPDWPSEARLAGELAAELTGQRLQLSKLVLQIPESGSRLTLNGEATLAPQIERSELTGRLAWSGLKWPIAGLPAELASPEGHLTLEGTPEAYRFTLAGGLEGPQLPVTRWQAEGSGDMAGLELERVQAGLLEGELTGAGRLRWEPAPGWDLRLLGRQLNPGQQFPDLPGRLDLELATQGTLDPYRGPQAEIDPIRLAGDLLGHPLKLVGKARLQGQELLLERLALAVAANRLSAKGSLSAQKLALDWSLQATDLGALIPDSSGRLLAEGSLDGSLDSPRLRASLTGEGLAFTDTSVAGLDGKVQAGVGPADRLELDLVLKGLDRDDEVVVQRLLLQARGKTDAHRLDLDIEGPTQRVQAQLQGGMNRAALDWRGRLESLTARLRRFGDWRMPQAAQLRLSPEAFELGEACVVEGASNARVCAAGTWSRQAGGTLTADVRNLDLARLVPDIGGALSGDVSGRLAGDGALTGKAAFAVTPGQVRIALEDGERRLDHGGGRLDLVVGPTGLIGDLEVKALQEGRVQANLRLPAFNRIPLPESQPIDGRVRARLPDLSGVQVWVPELSSTSGSLTLDVALSGQLAQPLIQGSLELSDGAADVPLAGLQLRQIYLRAVGDPQRPEQLDLRGGLVSGAGRLDLSGRMDVPTGALELTLQGESLEVYDTPDAHALLSPDLTLGWSDGQLKVRGKLLVSEAAITPKIAVSPSLLTDAPEAADAPGQVVAPSADVVVLGPGREEIVRPSRKAPIRIDSRIEVRLGERVNVNAVGFISRIGGAVTFTNRPAQTDLTPEADGRLLIQDGTFRAFGKDLDIEWGQVIFDRVPVTEPELDIRAVRWIDNDPQVSAVGVHVTGPARAPLLELFSRPQLDDSEIQSYLISGRSASSRDSVLSIGTYLRPRLYVGYGINLLERTHEFNSLYTITPRYGVEASVGEADQALYLTITLER